MLREEVWMVVRQVVMLVSERFRFALRPREEPHDGAEERKCGKDAECCRLAKSLPRPAGERISDQPARMAERELRCKQGGAILLARRTAEKAPGGGHAERIGEPHEEPSGKQRLP